MYHRVLLRSAIILALTVSSILIALSNFQGQLSTASSLAAPLPTSAGAPVLTTTSIPATDSPLPTFMPTSTPLSSVMPTSIPSPTLMPPTSFTATSLPTQSVTVTPLSSPPPSATPNVTSTPTIVPTYPTGSWSSPSSDGFILHADTLHLIIQALPAFSGGSSISRVQVFARWPGVQSSAGKEVCTITQQVAHQPNMFACDWNVRAANVPNGSLVLSFTVTDRAGHTSQAGLNIRQGQVQQPTRKVIVLLQGVCTAIGAGTDTTNTTFTALQNLLKTKQYGYTDADFLLYSYKGGTVDRHGQWIHHAYGQSDPIQQNFHGVSWSALHDQLLVPFHAMHPKTIFILVGHSLGGMVAWEELSRDVATPSYQHGFLAQVVTVDSPLDGVARTEVFLGGLLRRIPHIGSRLDCAVHGQAATVLENLHSTSQTVQRLRQVATKATQLGIHVTTSGNTDDCVWSPDRCGIPAPGDIQTQWITQSPAQVQRFSLPHPCLRQEPQCFIGTHGAALTNSNGPQALRTIAADIGPQASM